MKRLSQLAAAAIVALLVPVAASTPASAAFECEEGFTGPDSQNLCVSKQAYSCSITNDNKITIIGETEQDATTGTAEVNDSNTGGSATTGDAQNNNVTNYTLRIENGGTDNEICWASKVVPATETPEEPKPEPEPGRGETPAAPVRPAQEVTPSALPVTSGETAPLVFLLGGAAVTAGLVAAYRRLQL